RQHIFLDTWASNGGARRANIALMDRHGWDGDRPLSGILDVFDVSGSQEPSHRLRILGSWSRQTGPDLRAFDPEGRVWIGATVEAQSSGRHFGLVGFGPRRTGTIEAVDADVLIWFRERELARA